MFEFKNKNQWKISGVSSVDHRTVISSPSSALSQFLHNVTEYTYTNKEAQQEEDHKYYHPGPDAAQVRSSTNTGDDIRPGTIRNAAGICQESCSGILDSTDSGKIDAKHNPEDKAKW